MAAIAPHDERRLAYEGIAAARARIAGMLGERDSVLVFLRAALANAAREGAAPYAAAMTMYLHSEPAFHGMINDPEFRPLIAAKD